MQYAYKGVDRIVEVVQKDQKPDQVSNARCPSIIFQNDSFKARTASISAIAASATTIAVLMPCYLIIHSFNNRTTNRTTGRPKTDKDLSICAVLCCAESKLIKTP